MMIGLKVDMDSEALHVLNRLSNLSAYRIHRQDRLKKVALNAARQSYRRAFGGMREKPVKNVYTAVKKSLLGHNRRGLLTGSTFAHGIQVAAFEDRIEAGFIPESGSWPSRQGKAQQPLKVVAKFLEDVFGRKHLKAFMRGEQYFGTTRLGYLRMNNQLKGNVTMEWNASSLKIKWPQDAHEYLGLRDISMPSEPYIDKKYYKDRQKRFFFMTLHNIKAAFDVVIDYVENLMQERPSKARGYKDKIGSYISSTPDYGEHGIGTGKAEHIKPSTISYGDPTQATQKWGYESGKTYHPETGKEVAKERAISEQIKKMEPVLLKKYGQEVVDYVKELTEFEAEQFLSNIKKGLI